MGKDLNGNDLGKGFRQRADGRYEGRKTYKGNLIIDICEPDFEICQLRYHEELSKWFQFKDLTQKKDVYTLDEWFLGIWFDTFKRNKVKLGTLAVTESLYRNTYQEFFGRYWVHEITYMDAQRVTNSLAARGIKKHRLEKMTANLRESLDCAIRQGLLEKNPFYDIIVPRDKKIKSAPKGSPWSKSASLKNRSSRHKPKVLTVEQEKHFLIALQGSVYEPAIQFMRLTGIRVGELGGLCEQDRDYENHCVWIERNLIDTYVKGVRYFEYDTTKSDVERRIPLSPLAEFYWDKALERKAKLKEGGVVIPERWADAVFTTRSGIPVRQTDIFLALDRVTKRWNEQEVPNAIKEHRNPILLPHINPHMLRHTFCTRCVERDMSLEYLSEIAGHSSMWFTLKTYVHSDDKQMDEEYRKFYQVEEAHWGEIGAKIGAAQNAL